MVKRNSLVSALCIGCTLLTSASAWATSIEPGQGSLSINQGQGFKPVQSSATGNVGDSVMVGPGGSATIVYDDGCRVPVQPGGVATIAPLSPCASGSYAADMAVKAAPPAQATPMAGWGWQDAVFWPLFIGVGVFIGVEASRHGETTTLQAASH